MERNPVNDALPSFDGLVLSLPQREVAHLSLLSPPANTLNLTMWESLLAALRAIEKIEDITVLLISSSLDRPIFSAGNDISELHAPSTSQQRFFEFWTTSTTFLASLYRSRLYTIAAIRGACPAGGCIIALCCDYRIALAEGLRFGLNEAALGIPVPKFWVQLFVRTGTAHRAEVERLLFLGTMIDAEDALRLGFIDRAVPSGLLDEAHCHAAKMADVFSSQAGIVDVGRKQVKRTLRNEFALAWDAYGPEEAHQSWELLCDDAIAEKLGAVLRMLRNTRRNKAKL